MNRGCDVMLKRFLPIVVEKDEDGFYVVECPIFKSCYTQGKTLDEAVKNIKEVIDICLEEKENKDIFKDYNPKEISFLTISHA
jgi:predicted RNase H-like HicB family nuclease